MSNFSFRSVKESSVLTVGWDVSGVWGEGVSAGGVFLTVKMISGGGDGAGLEAARTVVG